MSIKWVSLGIAAGLIGSAWAAVNPMGAVPEVVPGAWTSSFTAAKEYADKNNVPMFIFWANPSCIQCEKTEAACKKDDFKKWMAEKQYVFVFGYGISTKDLQACKAFVKNSSGEFPYMGAYWKSNPKGVEVLEKFTGRSGKIGHGANTKDELGKQLMTAFDNILEGWVPGGTVMPDPDPGVTPDPDPGVTPDPDPGVTPEPDPGVTPEPTPEPVNLKKVYGKTQTIYSLVHDDDLQLVGTAKITVGRISSRNQVRVTVAVTPFVGASTSAKITVIPDDDATISGTLRLRSPFGEMACALTYDLESGFGFSAENDKYAISTSEVAPGGLLDADSLEFSASWLDDIELTEGYDLLVDGSEGTTVKVSKGYRFSFDRAPTVSYKRIREDGETYYELKGLDDESRPNVTALKLSYNRTTGVFKGTFRIYASNADSIEEGRKPTLKKYTAKVNGVIIDGEGSGMVSVKIGRNTYKGECHLW